MAPNSACGHCGGHGRGCGHGQGHGLATTGPSVDIEAASNGTEMPTQGRGWGWGKAQARGQAPLVAVVWDKQTTGNYNPAQIEIDNQQKWRTKEQIAADNAEAEASHASEEKERKGAEEDIVQKLATAEDGQSERDRVLKERALWPDLFSPSKRSGFWCNMEDILISSI